MIWEKLGKIFDPTSHAMPIGCVEYAQSPQALMLDNVVRIYFSTRSKDVNNKYLSHIAFVDFSKDLRNVINVSSKPVIELGKLGTFDEHGIFPISPVRLDNKIVAYTCGWSRRVSVPVETSIGLAISHDNGQSFEKIGEGPIMGSSLHEPFLVGDAFVRLYDGHHHMWYIYGTLWTAFPGERAPDRVYKIGHAISQDGLSWQREGKQIIPDKLNEDECQALPSVVHFNDQYHMVFCYRHATRFRTESSRSYRIGYAFSSDLTAWTRNDDLVRLDTSPGHWDSDMMCYPHLFECNSKLYLLYNGNEFGRFGFGLAVLDGK